MAYRGEKKPKICFKKGVELVEEDGRVGATLNGRTIWAREAIIGRILKQVFQKARDAETYAAELAITEGHKDNENGVGAMSIALVTFILDYSDFLKPNKI